MDNGTTSDMETGSDPAASPSDIDEMFGEDGGASNDGGGQDEGGGEMASQEDIDELFQ